jgi:hypothetical protein
MATLDIAIAAHWRDGKSHWDSFSPDRDGLEKIHDAIVTGSTGWLDVGAACFHLIRSNIWRLAGTFKTFKQYAEKLLGKTQWWVYRHADAYQVCQILADEGYDRLPTCEAQCRPLAKFLDRKNVIFGHDEIGLCEAWQLAIDTYDSHQLTAAKIDAIVNPEKEPSREKLNLPKELLERIQQRARDEGKSVAEYLEEIFPENAEPESESESELEPEPEQVELLDELDLYFDDVRVSITKKESVLSFNDWLEKQQRSDLDRPWNHPDFDPPDGEYF